MTSSKILNYLSITDNLEHSIRNFWVQFIKFKMYLRAATITSSRSNITIGTINVMIFIASNV